jgi:acetyl esterase/lipase
VDIRAKPRGQRRGFIYYIRMAIERKERQMKAMTPYFFMIGVLGAMPLAAEDAALPEASKPAAELFNLLPGQNCVPHYAVPCIERKDSKLTADIYLPKGEGPFPGLVLIHGGGWAIGSSLTVMPHGRKFAEAGYSVLAVNYRKAPKDKFPAQLDDVRDAIRWFQSKAKDYKLDPARIGAWGYSAGGHLAALTAVTESDAPGAPRLRCVCAGGAPVDFTALPVNSEFLSFWLGGSPKERPDVYKAASPMSFITKDDPPFLFFHGSEDKLVPIAGAKKMVGELKAAGVAAEFYEVRGKEHILAHWDSGAFRAALQFFDQHLKPQPAGR